MSPLQKKKKKKPSWTFADALCLVTGLCQWWVLQLRCMLRVKSSARLVTTGEALGPLSVSLSPALWWLLCNRPEDFSSQPSRSPSRKNWETFREQPLVGPASLLIFPAFMCVWSVYADSQRSCGTSSHLGRRKEDEKARRLNDECWVQIFKLVGEGWDGWGLVKCVYVDFETCAPYNVARAQQSRPDFGGWFAAAGSLLPHRSHCRMWKKKNTSPTGNWLTLTVHTDVTRQQVCCKCTAQVGSGVTSSQLVFKCWFKKWQQSRDT